MKINSLKLRGFIGIKKGLGLDEIAIDLSGARGLVAFDGPNGRGKTTILDNLTPYRQLASRNKALQHHVFLRDSFRDLEFEHAGASYRSLIKIDADAERTEAFIWKDGAPQVDGKVSSYDRYVADLFGSPQLFFNSVFCAQNAEKISEMTTGELKKLFSEFLRLDRLVEYETTARQVESLLGARIGDLAREIEKAAADSAGKDGLASRLAEAAAAFAQGEARRAAVAESIARMEAALEKGREAARKNESARLRIAELEADLSRLNDDLEAERRASESELAALRGKASSIQHEIREVESLLKRRGEVAAAAARADRLEKEAAGKSGALEALQAEIIPLKETIGRREREKLECRGRILSLEKNPDLLDLEYMVKTRRERMADLEKKDPECKSATCSFIVGALKAEKELPEYEKRLRELAASIDRQKAEAREAADLLGAEIRELKSEAARKTEAAESLKKDIAGLKASLAGTRALAADQPKIDVALSRKGDLEKRREELNQEGLKLKKAWETRTASTATAVKQVSERLQAAGKELDPEADQRVAALQKDLPQARAELSGADSELARLKASIPVIEKEIEAKTAAEARLRELSDRRLYFTRESSDWAYLRAACSRDGLRALEIDSVAPIISGYANDLLTQTFGPRYAVKFRTQDEETGREVLDILVIREDGSEVLLDNLSGGERVWSLKALRLAMTLIAKEKSGKNFQTALSDEEDGALDAENARSFISLYRAFMAAGGFETCFYITHKPDCVAMADHVLRFGEGGITIE